MNRTYLLGYTIRNASRVRVRRARSNILMALGLLALGVLAWWGFGLLS